MGIRAELRKWLQWRLRYSHWFGLADIATKATKTAKVTKWLPLEDFSNGHNLLEMRMGVAERASDALVAA
jgi:hypothetical protein